MDMYDFRRIEADILHTIPLLQAGNAMTSLITLLSSLSPEELESLVFCVNAVKYNTEPSDDGDDHFDEYAHELAYRFSRRLAQTLWNDGAFWWSRLATDLAPIAGMAGELS